MFHFPTLPPPALCVQAGAMGHYAHSGFPIRKSPDRSLVADSPRLIAGSYVLLRLLVPRHPPCALINLNQRCSRPLCSSQGTGGDRPLVRCLLASASGSAGGRSARNGPVLV